MDNPNLSWVEGNDISVKLVAHNVPAAGQPTISGGAQVGKTLTAATVEIEEPNALPENRIFTYQWVRVDSSGNETTISGATSGTYTLTTSGVGHTVKVKVGFTNFRGNAEGPLTSDVYPVKGAVVPAASRCPAANDWCTTMTVADAEGDGITHGYEFEKFGSLLDDTIEYGGDEFNVFTVYSLTHPHPSINDRIYFGSNPGLPLGTVVTLDEYTFTTDAESHDGSGHEWEFPSDLPTDLVWSVGREVTVSVRFVSPCEDTANRTIVKNLTGEITEAGESQFHRIRLDPYRSYLIEAIGQVGEDMLGVEEHANLTLSNPDIPAIWNAKGTSKWIKYGDRNDGDQAKNVIRRFLRIDYRTYKVEVDSGTGGTGTYQLKIRVNNVCRIDDEGNTHYHWAGGPQGYPADSDLPAGTGGRQVLLAGTDWGDNNVTRPELHHGLGDNWDSTPDEDWIGIVLEEGEKYTVRLRTKNNLPERLQATQLKILGMNDANGNDINGTASAGVTGKKVFLTEWTAPSTGRFHIAIGSEGNDLTGMYWISMVRNNSN